jgi:PAS domain-containing protein
MRPRGGDPAQPARRSEADVGAAEERFALADNLTEAVLIYRDKQPLFANGAYVELFGYSSMTDALREISPLMNLPLEEPAGDGTGVGGRLGAARSPYPARRLRRRRAAATDDAEPPVTWNGDRATMLTINRDPRRPGRAVTPAHAAAPRVGASPHGKTGGVPAPDNPALLHELMDSVPVILAHKSRDLRYTYVNQTYADWVGLPRDQIIGHHVCNVRNEAHYR